MMSDDDWELVERVSEEAEDGGLLADFEQVELPEAAMPPPEEAPRDDAGAAAPMEGDFAGFEVASDGEEDDGDGDDWEDVMEHAISEIPLDGGVPAYNALSEPGSCARHIVPVRALKRNTKAGRDALVVMCIVAAWGIGSVYVQHSLLGKHLLDPRHGALTISKVKMQAKLVDDPDEDSKHVAPAREEARRCHGSWSRSCTVQGTHSKWIPDEGRGEPGRGEEAPELLAIVPYVNTSCQVATNGATPALLLPAPVAAGDAAAENRSCTYVVDAVRASGRQLIPAPSVRPRRTARPRQSPTPRLAGPYARALAVTKAPLLLLKAAPPDPAPEARTEAKRLPKVHAIPLPAAGFPSPPAKIYVSLAAMPAAPVAPTRRSAKPAVSAGIVIPLPGALPAAIAPPTRSAFPMPPVPQLPVPRPVGALVPLYVRPKADNSCAKGSAGDPAEAAYPAPPPCVLCVIGHLK
mmetsp:Transcript_1086/g.4357  ORF Transcript_1086/g.4357 Transcript_1086/m.4357 type:complete len:464 (-) Transcript_1086:100-1491(-)